ncbi:MAG: hypothetical protein NVSMB65_16780 [Chloroflexota bacterium]
MAVVDFRIHDVVRLRKPHPCGGYEWEVYRLGADIGLRCRTCAHHVLLARPVLEKRLKKFVARGDEIPLSMFFPTVETHPNAGPADAGAPTAGADGGATSVASPPGTGGEA